MSGEWSKVPARWRDVTYLDPKFHIVFGDKELPIEGYSLFRYGKLMATWGLVRINDKDAITLASRPQMRKFPRVMVREGHEFMDSLSDVYAYADDEIKGSDRYILHYGFVKTGNELNGMKEYYYG